MIDEDQGYLQVNTPQEILEKAGKLISGPRAVQHGTIKFFMQGLPLCGVLF
jgi:hypothetical protein